MIAQQRKNDFNPDKVIETLQRHLSIHKQLRELSRQQRDLITADDPQPLLMLLADRQQLVDELTKLNRVLLPLQPRWREYRAQLSASVGERIDALLRETTETLQLIIAADQQDAGLLAARKAGVAGEMATLNQGRQAFDAYAADSGQGRTVMSSTDESA